MKRFSAFLLVILSLMLPAGFSESALSAGGKEISTGEADAYMYMVRLEYKDICDYYQRCLGIDFWNLIYPNGLSVWTSVKSDAFKQLVMMDLMCAEAEKQGIKLEEAEAASLKGQASRLYAEIEGASFALEDMCGVFEKNLLSRKAYSLLVSMTEVDEEAVKARVDASACRALRAEYLCAPYYLYEENDAAKDELTQALQMLSDFEGPWSDAAKGSGSFDSGYLVLSREEIGSDASLQQLSDLSDGQVSRVIETQTGLFVFRIAQSECSELYDAKVEEALWNAREKAFSTQYERMYHECEYQLNQAYWDALKP